MSRITDKSAFIQKNFRSTGIRDEATSNTVFITDDNVTVNANLVVGSTNVLLDIDDRMQVANTVALVNDRMQVANVASAISTAVSNLVNSAPSTLDTLNELANALGNNASFATSVATNLGQRLGATASISLTGAVTGSGSFSSNSVSISTSVNHNHDSTYVNVSGDTMTGNLNVTGTVTADGLIVDGATDGTPLLLLQSNNDSGTKKNTLQFKNTDGVIVDGDTVGSIEFYSSDVTNPGVGAYIDAYATSSGPSINLLFGTRAGGTLAERMRIDSSGNVGIGATNPIAKFQVGTQNTVAAISIPNCTIGNQAVIATASGSPALSLGYYSVGYGMDFWVDTSSPWNSYIDVRNANSGVVFRRNTNNSATESMRIDSSGNVGINQSSPSQKLHIGDGSDGARGVVSIEGAGGQHLIFSEASTHGDGSSFALRPASGQNFTIQADGTSTTVFKIDTSGNVLPGADATYNLGSPSYRWDNVYTTDLQLSNEGKGGNDIDGTTGNWTVQEGAEELYLINNKTGKKYAFMLREID